MESRHELAELILARKGSRSYDDLAKRSGLGRAAIHRMVANPIRALPEPDTLVKLAVALEVSIDRVAVAALRSAGVPVTNRFAAGDVLDGLDQLTPSQRFAGRASHPGNDRPACRVARTGRAARGTSRPAPHEHA